MLRFWPALLYFALLACGLPRDPEKTSERIAATHELRVGVTDNGAWVKASAPEPSGIEPDLLRNFASRSGARILWTRGSETKLVQSLKQQEIDVALGGFDAKTPWKSIAGVSQPFAETSDNKKHVMLTSPGENRFLLTLDTFLIEHRRRSEGNAP